MLHLSCTYQPCQGAQLHLFDFVRANSGRKVAGVSDARSAATMAAPIPAENAESENVKLLPRVKALADATLVDGPATLEGKLHKVLQLDNLQCHACSAFGMRALRHGVARVGRLQGSHRVRVVKVHRGNQDA